MKVFKRILDTRRKNRKEGVECWYNNYHEKKKGRWTEPIEGAAFSSPSQTDYALSQSISDQQT